MQHLREAPLEQTTMKRTIGVTLRSGGYLSPAAQGMLQMLRDNGGDFLVWA